MALVQLIFVPFLSCFILLCMAQNQPYCPPVEFCFLLDESENAKAAASDDPKNEMTKFNILSDQLKNVFNNSVLLRSPLVSISAYGYSGSVSLEIIPPGTNPANAASTLDRLRNVPNSGSWTYFAFKNITRPPVYTTNVLFLVTSQGSATSTRRNLTLSDVPRIQALNWNISIFAMVSNNPFDFVELSSISSSMTVLNDTSSVNPKSYRILSSEVNKVINNICSLYPTTTSTTTTSTTKSTSTTTRTTSNKKNKSTKKPKNGSSSSESKEDSHLDSSEHSSEYSSEHSSERNSKYKS